MKLAMKATDTCLKTTTNNNTYALFCIMSFFEVLCCHRASRADVAHAVPRGRPPCAAAVAAILAPRRGMSPSRTAFPRSGDGRARRAPGGPPVGTSVVPPLPLRGGGPLRPRRRDPPHPRAAVAVALAAEATTLAAAEAGRRPAPSRNAAADPDAVASFFAATVVVASGVRATRGDAKGDKPMAGPPLKRSNVPMNKCPQV